MAIVVTLLVLLVDASIKSRSPGPVKTLSSQAWVDQVLPILGETISQGVEINQLRTAPVATSAKTILPELQGLVANASQTVTSAQALKPPATIEGPSGLLIICLETRLEGAQTLSAAMSTALTTTVGNAAAVTQIQKATTEFQVADQAYALFLQHMPAVGVQLPTSVWLSESVGVLHPDADHLPRIAPQRPLTAPRAPVAGCGHHHATSSRVGGR